MKKKIIGLAMLCMMCFGVSAQAAKVVGQAQHTDIAAYINHYAIPSYAVKGTSVVVAEDLRGYGFDVVWNGNDKTLSISRNANTWVNPVSFYKESVPNGTKFADIYATDIKVYANGQEITSYAMNGYTMVPMESLTMFGEVAWVSELRALKMWVDGLNVTDYKPVPKLYSNYVEFERLFNAQATIFENDLMNRLNDCFDTMSMRIAISDSAASMLDECFDVANLYLAEYNKSYCITMSDLENAASDARDNLFNSRLNSGEIVLSGGTMDYLTMGSCYWDAVYEMMKAYYYELYRYTGNVVVQPGVG